MAVSCHQLLLLLLPLVVPLDAASAIET